MQLPQPRKDQSASSILPRRREALDNPDSAWDLLDGLHRLPGMIGSAISSRAGKILLSDSSDETRETVIENIARVFARDLREVVGRLGMGPLRLATFQSTRTTLTAAPLGPGMLASLGDSDKISLVELRHRMGDIQDELGRVELSSVLSQRNPDPSNSNSAVGERKHGSRVFATVSANSAQQDPGRFSTTDPVEISVSDAQVPQEIALDELQSAEIVDERGVVMVFIPGGTFTMGSNDSPDEMPEHEVTISPFLIDKYPVTNEGYDAFLEESALWRPGAPNSLLLDDDYLDAWDNGRMPVALAQHPVVWVSWWQVLKGYCAWRGEDGRLPTEAEWEFAGRGTDGRVFPWGNQWRAQRCNHYRLGAHWTSAVGQFPEGRSPFGVMDMSGNAWEWCMDWYSPDAYAHSERENPAGPSYGRARSIRGGSRFNHASFVKLTKRLYFPHHRSDLSIGFRCVKPWPPKSML